MPSLQVPCQVLAMLLHFFFLSVFAWMLVEGLHLYSMVIKVFGSEDSKHLYYYGIGWGRCGGAGAQGAISSSYRPSHLAEAKTGEPCWPMKNQASHCWETCCLSISDLFWRVLQRLFDWGFVSIGFII